MEERTSINQQLRPNGNQRAAALSRSCGHRAKKVSSVVETPEQFPGEACQQFNGELNGHRDLLIGRPASVPASGPAGPQDPLRGFGIAGACEEHGTHHLADVPNGRSLTLVVGPLLGRCQCRDDALKSGRELGPHG